MSETSEPRSMPTRLIVAGDTKLVLPRHIKLRHDPGRGRWIILAPERVFESLRLAQPSRFSRSVAPS